jgi:Na+/proline symporter
MDLLAQRAKRQKKGQASRTFVMATVVCLVLLALLAVIQVAHVHPQDNDADHCPLCMAIHAVVPVTLAAAVIILIQVGTPCPVLEPDAILRHWHPTLFTRPPPAAL